MITLDLSILNQKGTPMFNSDLTANRPAAGIVGRIFIATDSPYGIFRDTGTAWDQVSSAGGATIYTNNGTLTGDRIVSSGGFNLTFNPQTTFDTTSNADVNLSSYATLGINRLTYSAGFSANNIGATYGSIGGFNLQTFDGNATFANSNIAAANSSINSVDFKSSGHTITITQATGIRAMAGHINMFQFQGSHDGTITHAAISQNLGFYKPAGSPKTLTITNAYSLLINDLDDYGGGFIFTNRWGIYQAGVNDKNFFAAASTFGERLNIESDSTITTQSSSAIVSTTTNANLVLSPNGTGALLASIPTGTASGGNSRGSNAVDLQTSRTLNTQVASGANSIILGGQNNTSSFTNCISGGTTNTSSGSSSVALGNSNNSTNVSSIALGLTNTASGSASFAAGSSNTSSGETSITFGRSNTNSGLRNFVAGNDNINSGSWCSVFGREQRNYSDYCLVTGRYAFSYLINSFLNSNTNSNIGATSGALQTQSLIASRFINLSSTGTANLSLDGTGVTNLIIPYHQGSVSKYRAWNVKVSTVVIVESITGTATGITLGDSFSENRNLLFKQVNNIATLVGIGTAEIFFDTSMSTALMSYSAGTSQQLQLTFNAPSFAGGGSVLFRVVSNIQIVEVAL